MQKISFSNFFVTTVMLALVGCASQPSPTPVSAIDSDAAKIRLFGINSAKVTLTRYKNSDCSGGTEKIAVSGDVKGSLASMFHLVDSTSLGMTETKNSKNVSDMGGIVEKAYFKEYALKAGTPVTISMAYLDAAGHSCSERSLSLVAEANAEYEGMMKVDWEAKTCHYVLNKIMKTGELEPLASDYKNTCPSQAKAQ